MDILCTARLLRKAKKPVRLRGKGKDGQKAEDNQVHGKDKCQTAQSIKKKGKIYYSVRAYKR